MEAISQDQTIHLFSPSVLSQDISAFLLDRRARGLSNHTVRYYSDELRYFREYIESQSVRETLSVSAQHIRKYLLSLEEHRNAGGVLTAYRALRAFFYWFEEEMEPDGWKNPIRKVSPPKRPKELLEPLSLEDLRKMLATCKRKTFAGDRDRAILLALLDTGCRASEFVALNVEDVNLADGTVIVRHGKGDKSRVVFLGRKARQAVLRYLRHRRDAQPTSPLWVTVKGGRLSYWGLRQIVRRRAKKAGVPVPSLHSFRRAFALLSLRAGVDVFSLQRLMGHSDLTVLRRYLKQAKGDLQAAHEKAGVVDKLL